MEIGAFFGSSKLTVCQREAIGRLADFFDSDVPCFLLKGYAGTGKTFLLKGMVEYLKSIKRTVILTAPTGRAAQVLTEKAGSGATTIHRMLYFGESMRDTAEEQGVEYDVFKLFYGTSENAHPADTVYISDEASMISNVYSENDLMKFGSGYLMDDLIRYIWPDPAGTNRKLIFVGDTAQLPPVNMNNSPALNAEYLKEKFNLSCMEYELTDVVRQIDGSGILQNATRLREHISQNRFGSIRLEGGNNVLLADLGNIVSDYLSLAGEKKEEAVVVAYSNKSVYAYNCAIRQQLYPGEKNPVVGDRLVVVHNNYLHGRELLNGESGTLVAINNEHTHTHHVVVRVPRKQDKGETEYKVKLRFREAVIRFSDASGIYDIECMILDNVLFSGRRDLTYLENVALLVDFKNRWGANQKAGKTDFRTDMRADPYFNAVRVKFGYALTCHKAQGGEWKNVLVNCVTGMGYNNEYYFRWLYTAITRAREKLLLINAPSFNQSRLLRETGVSDEAIMPGGQQAISKESNAIAPGSNLSEFIHSTTDLFISSAEKAGYKTEDLKQLPYGLQFVMFNDSSKALIKVYYSAKLKITSIEGVNGEGNAGPGMIDAFDFLKLPSDKKKFHPSSDQSAEKLNPEPMDKGFLNILRQKIQEVTLSAGISIVKVESHSYHEIYFFEAGLKYAMAKFYYNKKQQFTRFEIVGNKSNGLENELAPLFKNLEL